MDAFSWFLKRRVGQAKAGLPSLRPFGLPLSRLSIGGRTRTHDSSSPRLLESFRQRVLLRPRRKARTAACSKVARPRPTSRASKYRQDVNPQLHTRAQLWGSWAARKVKRRLTELCSTCWQVPHHLEASPTWDPFQFSSAFKASMGMSRPGASGAPRRSRGQGRQGCACLSRELWTIRGIVHPASSQPPLSTTSARVIPAKPGSQHVKPGRPIPVIAWLKKGIIPSTAQLKKEAKHPPPHLRVITVISPQ